MQQKTIQLILGIVLILGGIVVLLNPTVSAFTLLAILGALLLIYGVAQLVFASRTGTSSMPLSLLSIASIILGTVLILSRFFKVMILSLLSFALGVALLVRGIFGIVMAVRAHNFSKTWWVALVIGIAYVVLGVLLFIFPMSTGNALVILLGVALIATGIDTLVRRFST